MAQYPREIESESWSPYKRQGREPPLLHRGHASMNPGTTPRFDPIDDPKRITTRPKKTISETGRKFTEETVETVRVIRSREEVTSQEDYTHSLHQRMRSLTMSTQHLILHKQCKPQP